MTGSSEAVYYQDQYPTYSGNTMRFDLCHDSHDIRSQYERKASDAYQPPPPPPPMDNGSYEMEGMTGVIIMFMYSSSTSPTSTR